MRNKKVPLDLNTIPVFEDPLDILISKRRRHRQNTSISLENICRIAEKYLTRDQYQVFTQFYVLRMKMTDIANSNDVSIQRVRRTLGQIASNLYRHKEKFDVNTGSELL